MSVYDINGLYKDIIYDINGDALSVVYDMGGNAIPITSFLDYATITNVYTSTVTSQPQGACIDDSGNVYVCFYNAGKFLKYNIQSGTSTEYDFTSGAYGHANDATFCPGTGLIYLASMNTTGEVYALDPSNSMALFQTYIVKGRFNTPTQIWCLAYNRVTGQFIAFDTNNDMLFYDADFNLVSHKNIPDLNSVWTATRQGMETDGAFIYAISYQPNRISVISMDGKLIKQIGCSDFTGEPETMCYDWINDVYYIEGKSTYYVIKQAVFKE